MQHGELPGDVVHQRTTDEFDVRSVPPGLLRAHHLAPGVWGLLRVVGGSVSFVHEEDGSQPIDLAAGDSMVIVPEIRHHVEPARDGRFVVEFHKVPPPSRE